MTPRSEPRLWVCACCELVGSEWEAERHMEDTGHAIAQLEQDVSDGVREAWAEGRVNRIAGLMMLARWNRAAA